MREEERRTRKVKEAKAKGEYEAAEGMKAWNEA